MSSVLPVINLMGPTASGKTALACELYEQGGFELISVDSALIYKDMDIGTAKPTKEEQVLYPHHLIDIISPLEVYIQLHSLWKTSVRSLMIYTPEKTPILVGGTMLYFKALLEGLSTNLPNADQAIRKTIEQKAEYEGWEAVYAELCEVDPLAGQKFRVSDRQRITRALEVLYHWPAYYKTTGRTAKNLPYRYTFHNHALLPNRLELHERIEKRLKMWEIGF